MSQKNNPKKIPLIKFSKRVKDLLCSRKQSKKNFQLVSKNNYKYFKRSKLFFDYCYCFPYEFYKDNSFRFHLYTKQKIKMFNGHLKNKFFKNLIIFNRSSTITQTFNFHNYYFFLLNNMEKRFDYVLYRSFFVLNLKQSKQMIKQGHVKINKVRVKNFAYLLKTGDLISISSKFHKLINYNIKNITYTNEILEKSLQINYKTLQICFVNPDIIHIQLPFSFYANSVIRYFI